MDLWEAFDTLIGMELWLAQPATARANQTVVQLEHIFIAGAPLREIHVMELNAARSCKLPLLDQRLGDSRSDTERARFRRVVRDAIQNTEVRLRRQERAWAVIEIYMADQEPKPEPVEKRATAVSVPEQDSLDAMLADLRLTLNKPAVQQDREHELRDLRILLQQRDHEIESLRQHLAEQHEREESNRSTKRRLDNALLVVARLNRRIFDLTQEVNDLTNRNRHLEQELLEIRKTAEFHAGRVKKLMAMVNELAAGKLGHDVDAPEPLLRRGTKKRTPEQVQEDRRQILKYVMIRGRVTSADITAKFLLPRSVVSEEIKAMLSTGQLRAIRLPGAKQARIYEAVPDVAVGPTTYDHIMAVARSMPEFQAGDVPTGRYAAYLKIQKLVRDGTLRRRKVGKNVFYSLPTCVE
ncbi:hypothetical protein [Azospirillum rugosum]|uniref:Uncharacterized protein n=1 Tax=Azospirillum rugosum TaxID=416170 RepID=A0ABS4SVL3_9PROT|nr:hypothetical protein [Azospirillum rugosum]MBP2296600.1 hypothetical protein [Azospirillum rugosum]MDQ0530341.1 hypothetical protein [Azospirillum rugosum]